MPLASRKRNSFDLRSGGAQPAFARYVFQTANVWVEFIRYSYGFCEMLGGGFAYD